MKFRIPPPKQLTTDPDVALECERAVDAPVQKLADLVITAGWPPEAVFQAIKRVAHRQAAAFQKDPDPTDDPVSVRPRTGFSMAPF
ncbi:hypothetical protein [Sinorhizobium sp. RAC02]|uniref:hypothetical protein n=1 Tax=Sinorhizobium sp. RAC02 TaxID=1842534 RepID=UPI00083DE82F|nr:hypothetical protein [Sinorhizobium sp. RAC02]AOF93030.1 hypothetical protein BSY16_4706 [Sinorhizobium sp. RAC02]